MKTKTREKIAEPSRIFHLPKYEDIPDVGLYLEQTVKYINSYFDSFDGMNLTASMVSNYVKRGLIANPVKKRYDRTQIAYLFFIATAKTVLSLEDIQSLITLQKGTYDAETAYQYFRREFENILFFIFGLKDTLDEVGVDSNDEKAMLRKTIITVAHKVYLDKGCRALQGKPLT